MKKNITTAILVLISVFMACRGTAQENFASQVTTSVSDGEKLLISYDIIPAGEAGLYTVVLNVTHKRAQVNTPSAYGDLGHNISPGREKAIVWYFKDDFAGNIADAKVEVFAYRENPPKALFEIVSMSNKGYAPSEVRFKNNSVLAEEYEWDFGDPGSGTANLSSEKDPIHIYEKGGDYTIALIAKNPNTRLENAYYSSIKLKSHDPVVADFEIKGNNQTAPAKVEFKSTSENADSFNWDFGDPSAKKSNSSTKENGSITYKNPGTYIVKLSVKNKTSGLSGEISKEVTVESSSTAVANFIYTKTSETAPTTVSFMNTSTSADRLEWDFGDPSSKKNNSSTQENPDHLFEKPGSYKVKLTVWAKGVKKPSVFSEVIKIDKLPNLPEASFTIQNNNEIGPATIRFKNSSQNASKFSWNFGDPASGKNNISDKKEPTHTYKDAGRYEVVLTVSGSGNAGDSRVSDWVVITSRDATEIALEALFSTEKGSYDVPAVVNFSDRSSGADSWSWNFGDSNSQDNTSDLKNPTHLYSKAGRYKVTLVVKNKSTGRSAEFTDYVNVATEKIVDPVIPDPPKTVVEPLVEKKTATTVTPITPTAGFEIKYNESKFPVTVEFRNLSTNAEKYDWNFGDYSSDDNGSTIPSPRHIYEAPGKYTVTLNAVSKTGESHQATKEIFLKSNIPVFVNDRFGSGAETALSIIPLPKGESLAVVKKGNNKSIVAKLGDSGNIKQQKEFDNIISGIVPIPGNKYMTTGIDGKGKLFVLILDSNLKEENPVVFPADKNLKTDYFHPQIAVSVAGDAGIIANTINDRYPLDLLFQKTDLSGRIIPLTDRTFKFIGSKLVTDIAPMRNGGFALTGYWQETKQSTMSLLFAKIDRKGLGEMQLITSATDIPGFSIRESFQDGFALLRAENLQSDSMYKISFALVTSDGKATDCRHPLPCSVKEGDVLRFKPAMITTSNEYVIASHCFNGVDYDISLWWVDRSGMNFVRNESLPLPGDQFVMDLVQTDDGGFLIAGTQQNNGKSEAIVIKTDAWGKMIR